MELWRKSRAAAKARSSQSGGSAEVPQDYLAQDEKSPYRAYALPEGKKMTDAGTETSRSWFPCVGMEV